VGLINVHIANVWPGKLRLEINTRVIGGILMGANVDDFPPVRQDDEVATNLLGNLAERLYASELDTLRSLWPGCTVTIRILQSPLYPDVDFVLQAYGGGLPHDKLTGKVAVEQADELLVLEAEVLRRQRLHGLSEFDSVATTTLAGALLEMHLHPPLESQRQLLHFIRRGYQFYEAFAGFRRGLEKRFQFEEWARAVLLYRPTDERLELVKALQENTNGLTDIGDLIVERARELNLID